MTRSLFDRKKIPKKFIVDDNLFAIHPPSGVVSFVSQQWRALELAHSLANSLQSVDGKGSGDNRCRSLAIIGGGFAGATCMVALKGLGFEQVSLFEAQDDLFAGHMSCEHRFSHPGINFWPHHPKDTRYFSATTQLPFMNWHAGRISEIVEQVKRDPALSAACKSKGVNYLHRLKRVKKDENGYILTFYDHAEAEETDPQQFNIVILATGFGSERNLHSSRSGSYWWADHIKHFRSEYQKFASSRMFIGGGGDGALIDFCRLASKTGNQLDANEPDLGAAFLSTIRSEAFTKLNDGDAALSEIEESLKLGMDESGDDAFHNTTRDLAEKSRIKEGEEFANPEWGKARQFLIDSFRSDLGNLKFVVDPEHHGQYFYRSQNSPINSLLTAMVLKGKESDHVCEGSMDADSQKLCLSDTAQDFKIGEDIHIARHGTHDLFEGIEFEGMDRPVRRRGKEDYLIKRDSLDPKHYGNVVGVLDLDQLYSLATDFFQNVVGVVSSIRFDFLQNDEICCVVNLQAEDAALEKFAFIGGVERNVFGLPTRYEAENIVAEDNAAYGT